MFLFYSRSLRILRTIILDAYIKVRGVTEGVGLHKRSVAGGYRIVKAIDIYLSQRRKDHESFFSPQMNADKHRY